jgi:hypothetical protein
VLKQGLPPSDNTLRHEPIPWTKRGIKKEDFPWVDPATSLQWHSFQRTVKLLQERGNHVFVLVGPFNEHMLTAKSQHDFQIVKNAITTWLHDEKIPYAAPPPLPSDAYADASHPLSDGYALLAKQLFELLSRKP